MYVSEENWAPEQSPRKIALTIILVLGLIVLSSSSKSMVHPEAEDVLDAPSLGGCNGTYLIVPPGISILLIYLGDMSVFKTVDEGRLSYWSKKGSKIMTSSPGSIKAMKAHSMPGVVKRIR